VNDERRPVDPGRIGPSRLLALCPVLAGALAVQGCRAVYAVTFGLDGGALAAADGNGYTYLWDTAGGLAATFAHPGSRGVIGVAFDPHGDLLAAADGNGRAYLWDRSAATWPVRSPVLAAGGVNGVAFAPHGGMLAAADGNGSTYIWKLSPHATSAYADPAEQLIGILLTQTAMDSPHTGRLVQDFWTSAYQAIAD